MHARVFSSAILGIDAYPVEIEANLTPTPKPQFITVGLPEGAVKESKERVIAAIRNSGFNYPNKKTVINLAPADIRKEGSAFDLPMAIGILAALGQVKPDYLDKLWLLGELALDGSLRPIRGALPIAISASNQGVKGIVLPEQNAKEAAVAEGVKVAGFETLRDVVSMLNGVAETAPTKVDLATLFKENLNYRRFIRDVAEQGIDIVEGPDVVEPSYSELRTSEYPSLEDQFDMQYHDQVDGTTTWKDTILAIKDKYPKTITGGTTIGAVPDWVKESADNWTFNKQLREYVAAVKRLDQYILSEGRVETREDVVVGTKQVLNEETGEFETVNITENQITQTAIEALDATVDVTTTDMETGAQTTETVKNPLIVEDEEQRAAAQAVVDATPQPVIDSLNN